MWPRFGLHALCLTLVGVLYLVSIEGQKIGNIDAYYLDPLGHICTDTVDTVQKVEYEQQIHCTVTPMLVCDDDDVKTSNDVVLGKRRGQHKESPHPGNDLVVQGNDPIHTFQRRPQTTLPKIKETSKQVCHTMSVKECKAINRPKQTKVRYVN